MSKKQVKHSDRAKASSMSKKQVKHSDRGKARWLAFYLVGVVILGFRFPFNTAGLNAYVFSTYLYSMIYYSIYNQNRISQIKRNYWFLIIPVWLISILPYQALKIDKYLYYGNRQRFYPLSENMREEYNLQLQTSLLDANFPGKKLLYVLLLILIVLIIIKSGKEFRIRFGIVSILTLVVSFRNSSFASPYSWVPSFEKTLAEKYFWVSTHFSDGSGAVNADEEFHSSLTQFFQNGDLVHSLILRRPLEYYLTAQFSFFCNAYYVWILINFLVVVLSALALNQLLTKYGVSAFTSNFTSALFVLSPMLLSTIGQSSSYTLAFVLPLLLIRYLVWLSENQISEGNITMQFASVIGMSLLVYDTLPWILAICLGIYALKLFKTKTILAGCALGIIAFMSVRIVIIPILKIPMELGSEKFIAESTKTILQQIYSLDLVMINEKLITAMGTYVQTLARQVYGFSFVSLLLLGIFYYKSVKNAPEIRVWAGALLFGSLLVHLFFTLGGVGINSIPRISGPGFSAFYLLFGLVFDAAFRKNRKLSILYAIFFITTNLLLDSRILDGWWLTFLRMVNG